MMQIVRPTLLVNEEKSRENIRKMVLRAKEAGVSFRPHMKTHQSNEIGEWFRDEGVDRIAVSSVDMAQYFAKGGWKDITIAFPYNLLEYQTINDLAAEVQLNVLIESKEALDHLNKHVSSPVGYFIKVDIGTHRTGIDPNDTKVIHSILSSSNSRHTLIGLLGHAGHSYQTDMNGKKAKKILNEAVSCFDRVKAETGRTDLVISYGDTPTCSLLDHFPGVNEIRPGNFVFYDLMQYAFRSCQISDISVCMACPVVALHPERGEVVIYGGAVHLSKDFIEVNGKRNYGLIVKMNDSGWETSGDAYLTRLSQEHGIVSASTDLIDSLNVGDVVGVLPIHSCLTADNMGHYYTLSGQHIKMRSKLE